MKQLDHGFLGNNAGVWLTEKSIFKGINCFGDLKKTMKKI